MAKGIQTSNGKAFEYACVDALHRMLSKGQEVILEESPQMQTAEGFFNHASGDLRLNLERAANAAARVILKLEPQLTYPEENGPLYLALQTDSKGQKGDVRDVLCIR